jgi:hypothetical protein
MIPDACLPRLGSPRSFEVCLQEMPASPDRNGGERGPGRLRADGLRAVRSPPGWLNWLVIAGIAWAQVGLGISLISDRTPRNLTLVISIEASGVYTLLLYLAVQTTLGAEGAAAHKNLFLEWLITMPWHAGMVLIFVRVQQRERYSAAAVLLRGAAYEAGADGTVGGLIVPAILGNAPGLLQHLAFLVGMLLVLEV